MRLLKSKAIGWRLIRILLMLTVCLLLLVHWLWPTFAFPHYVANMDSYQPVAETFQLTASDGKQLSAEWLPASSPADPPKTILLSHGNGEHIGHIRVLAREWNDLGFHVLTYDYRGYGDSEGSPSERGVERDIQAAWDWLTTAKNIPPGEIILYGRSVGGGPSCWLAEQVDCAGLVLESNFTSLFRVPLRGKRFPFIDPFPSIERLPNINCPLLIVHGTEDELIHPFHAEQNYAAAVEPKTLLWIDRAGHNDLHQRTGTAYEDALRRFLD